ncbi:DinB family protein [Flavobacterium rhizosphaerae]|uniref:DinB family protein n=1 Tax=Flavobacterium rhizosphaerae TaxID=3163298 RepID=A0ABW8YU79_9FLAO
MYNKTINALDKVMMDTIALIKGSNEKLINTIPFEGSWTAAQVARHLIKAATDMPALFIKYAPETDRQPDENVAEIKSILLDFDRKMVSPDGIVPEEKYYTIEELITDTDKIRQENLEALKTAQLNQVPTLQDWNPLNGYTKLELLHFVLYHTQRHNRQINKIIEKVHQGQPSL